VLGVVLAPSLRREPLLYRLAATSRFEVKLGKAGLLGFAGHEHVIRARAFSGRVEYDPAAPADSRVEVVVPTDSLEVLTPPDTEEIRKVTATMRTQVLDVAHYPEIRLTSRSIVVDGERLHIVVALTIKGVTREIPVDVRIARTATGDTLRATTTFSIKQTDFGIRPYRGGPGGTVRVADKVIFDVSAVAVRP
jgi:polyisoprenoid-binding protein YceI